MFGGAGSLVLVVLMRLLIARAWRDGIGLTLSRRLAVPALALVLGLVSARDGLGQVLSSSLAAVVLLGLVVTATAAVLRVRTAHWSRVAEAPEYPGGFRVRSSALTQLCDTGAVLVAAAITFPFLVPAVGLGTAGGLLVVVVALGDALVSVLLIRHARSTSVPRA